jgi:predicted HicB family RNase H-like nuclease
MAKKQIIFRLEEEIYQQLQIYAITNKTSVQKIVEEHILEVLKQGTTEPTSSP